MSYRTFPYILALLCILGVNCQNPELEIPQGRLRGATRTNRDGGTYYSFQNIPFGKAPVGERRFKIAEPAEGWEGTRDATEDLQPCPQTSGNVGISGQEDCLHLNIYIPEVPTEDSALKPTMVWIYGGGFGGGSAQESTFGADFLLTKDVVMVAINYRVGVFGFLSLDDSNLGVTGNAGLKDQVLGLQWVKDNIQYFGGDPDNVSIFGESAGAMSVHLQVLSPMSRGLFNKAISQSGVAISKTTQPYIRNNALLLAELLGIQTENWEEMISSLQSLSVEELIAGQTAGNNVDKYFIRPIVEVESVEPVFMPANPIDIMKSGDYNQVPYLLGTNNFEEMNVGQITDYTEFIPGEFFVEAGSEAEADIIARFKEVYDTSSSYGNIYLSTDYYFGFPAYRTAFEQAKNALYPMYLYYFSANTDLNNSNLEEGAAHGDELSYLFSGWSTSGSIVEEGSLEDLGIKNMVNLWTNFATYGNPTPEGSDFIWEPVVEGVVNYLHIDTEESVPSVDLNPERMQFWLDLYAEYFPETNESEG